MPRKRKDFLELSSLGNAKEKVNVPDVVQGWLLRVDIIFTLDEYF